MEGIKSGSLVLYKGRPALVKGAREKLEIELQTGGTISVRPKDVILLHPGPLNNLRELAQPEGEIETAWELLSEESLESQGYELAELAELIYGEYTPAAVWATWQLVEDGLYFYGSPNQIHVHSREEVDRINAARIAKQEEAQAWASFLQRVRNGKYEPQDERYLKEVEELALGSREDCRVLRELGHAETPETAHAFLLELGYWDYTRNPYLSRLGLPDFSPNLAVGELPDEERVDLTHLESFAIDDRDNKDPDDAISLDGNRIWVHVADVGALVSPDSPIDLEARGRGANLYLPDRTIHMLPEGITPLLGLGLSETSPALSFGIDLDSNACITGVEIVPSWVRVKRLSYEQVEEQMDEEPFASLFRIALTYREKRRENGALFIDLPEVIMRVDEDGIVDIRPIGNLRSRDMVQEAMLMTGAAAARYAIEHDIPFPYATQEPPSNDAARNVAPEPISPYGDLAGAYALRRALKRSRIIGQPAPHAGIGLPAYARATSPLRRYLDLVVHQQLRAHINGQPLLEGGELLERVGTTDAVIGSIRQAEWRSRAHWTLVFLLQNPRWYGKGVLVDKRNQRGTFIIPDLAFETSLHLRRDLPLNAMVEMVLKHVNLAALDAYFEVRV